jgi:hypothetical protein
MQRKIYVICSQILPSLLNSMAENYAFEHYLCKGFTKHHPDSVLKIHKAIHAHAFETNNLITTGASLQQMGQICFIKGIMHKF